MFAQLNTGFTICFLGNGLALTYTFGKKIWREEWTKIFGPTVTVVVFTDHAVFKFDQNTKKVQTNAYLTRTRTVCKFSGKFPLSGHKTTLKQINCQKRWKKDEIRTVAVILFQTFVFKLIYKNVPFKTHSVIFPLSNSDALFLLPHDSVLPIGETPCAILFITCLARNINPITAMMSLEND